MKADHPQKSMQRRPLQILLQILPMNMTFITALPAGISMSISVLADSAIYFVT
jgi:hypothetical protein